MTITRTYRTELDPNQEQLMKLYQFAGAVRFVYNWALARKIEAYQTEQVTLRQRQLQPELQTALRAEHPWLADIPSMALLAALQNNDRAFANFFRRVKSGKGAPGFPKFKSRKKGVGGFKFFSRVKVSERHINLPKLGPVRLKERGYLPVGMVKIQSGSVREQAGRWFVTITVEEERDITPATGPVVGIDRGIKSLVALSDGTIYDNPKTLALMEKRLKRLQRQLSRKQKGSKNRHKARQRVARLHMRIGNIRRDNQHKISHDIIAKRKPSAVVLEDLNVSGMMQNGNLAKALADAGMAELARQIRYKSVWYGVEVATADRWFASSKTCSACGAVKASLDLSVRIYRCDACGHQQDRDTNAACNLAALARE